MALHVLRNVTLFVRLHSLQLWIDETTDASNKEQVVLCCRWVDCSLEAHEDFIGLYERKSTEASISFAISDAIECQHHKNAGLVL